MTDTELLDAIQLYIMWPGPATIEIHENACNQTVIKCSGAKPEIEPVVRSTLREALQEWAKQYQKGQKSLYKSGLRSQSS